MMKTLFGGSSSSILLSKGFQVIEASRGEDALAILERPHGSIDALVTDIKMPGMTGFELARAVTAMNRRASRGVHVRALEGR